MGAISHSWTSLEVLDLTSWMGRVRRRQFNGANDPSRLGLMLDRFTKDQGEFKLA